MDIQEYQHIYIGIVPFRQFFSMHGVAVYSANMAKLPRSKASLYSRAARERGRTFFRGVANNTPYDGCCTLSGLPSESKARSFSQKLIVVHASLREGGLLSASATWSIRPLGKSTASFKPGIPMSASTRRTVYAGER